MAECVSCGKEIEAGKLFCEQCYAKMKGRRGPLKEAREAKSKLEEATKAEGKGTVREESQASTSGRVSAALTPSAQKKVVTLRPELEKIGKEKSRGKKRFTITITFSERTYNALARLGGRKRSRDDGVSGPSSSKAEGGRAAVRRKGPHGRPALTAVGGAARRGKTVEARPPGFRGWLAYRPRHWDGGDYVALAMASLSTLVILVLTFSGWVRISWLGSGSEVLQEVRVKGSDLGTLPYAAMAVVLLALLYVPVSLRLGGPFRRVDFGVALLAAGLVFLVIFYVCVASDRRIIEAATRLANAGVSVSVGEQISRQTCWPAFLEAFMGVVLAFSGLIRLSERRSEGAVGQKNA